MYVNYIFIEFYSLLYKNDLKHKKYTKNVKKCSKNLRRLKNEKKCKINVTFYNS